MNTIKRIIILGGLAVMLLLAGCASSPEPFEYEPNNELKPGPGLLTGEEGVYTIYGPPSKPAEKTPEVSEETTPAETNDPAAR